MGFIYFCMFVCVPEFPFMSKFNILIKFPGGDLQLQAQIRRF